MNGDQTLLVDKWQQGLNPDRYAGQDYVSSFTLTLQSNPDGSVQVIAAAAGRYQLVAWVGNQSYRGYIQISPSAVGPNIRGVHLQLLGGIADRSYATDVMTKAAHTGVNWVLINML